MSIEIINIGTLPNDGTGDPLRTAFDKINNNFAFLGNTATTVTSTQSYGLDPNQIIWEGPIDDFVHGKFQIRSNDPLTMDSQDITISAQILNDQTDVKWTGYSTTFNGIPVVTYDMDVFSGNVRLMVTPIVNAALDHFISATVTF